MGGSVSVLQVPRFARGDILLWGLFANDKHKDRDDLCIHLPCHQLYARLGMAAEWYDDAIAILDVDDALCEAASRGRLCAQIFGKDAADDVTFYVIEL